MSRAANLTLSDVARVAHDAVRTLQIVQNQVDPDLAWDRAPEWSRQDTRDSIAMTLAGVSPARLHAEWVRERFASGWTLGDTHDPVARTDPRLVPYEALDPALVAQDAVRAAVAEALNKHLK